MEKKPLYVSPGTAGKSGFEDLDFYQMTLEVLFRAHKLASKLPDYEKYDLASQIRRASKSTTANIAEGYGRYHYLDSLHFYSIARGSLNETLNHFITAKVLGYIDVEEFETSYGLIRDAEMALNGFINFVRRRRAGQDLFGDKVIRDEPGFYQDETSLADIDAEK